MTICWREGRKVKVREGERARARGRKGNRKCASLRYALRSASRRLMSTSKEQASDACALLPLAHLLDVHRCLCSLRPRKCLGDTSREEAGATKGEEEARGGLEESRHLTEAETTLFFFRIDSLSKRERVCSRGGGGTPPVVLDSGVRETKTPLPLARAERVRRESGEGEEQEVKKGESKSPIDAPRVVRESGTNRSRRRLLLTLSEAPST